MNCRLPCEVCKTGEARMLGCGGVRMCVPCAVTRELCRECSRPGREEKQERPVRVRSMTEEERHPSPRDESWVGSENERVGQA